MTDENMVRIAWEVIKTGEAGMGAQIERSDAEDWIAYLDEEYGATMRHWIHTDGGVVE